MFCLLGEKYGSERSYLGVNSSSAACGHYISKQVLQYNTVSRKLHPMLLNVFQIGTKAQYLQQDGQ